MNKLPDTLATALAVWMNEQHLTHHDVADAVRDALEPAEGGLWIVSDTNNIGVFRTTFPLPDGTDFETAMVIGDQSIEALSWTLHFHADGSIHARSCGCGGAAEKREFTTGDMVEIGEWTWNALPKSFTGFRHTH